MHGMNAETDGYAQTAAQRLAVRNELPEIATVTDALEAFARAQALPDAIVWRFHLALEELLRNIIAHAYPDRLEHDIEITIDCDGTSLKVTISDDGVPFNPLNAQPPDLSAALDDREIGGLGIHLARNVVETLHYAWLSGRNVVTLESTLLR